MPGGLAGEAPDQGFSIIEMVIATLVLIIAILSLTTILVNSLSDSTYARQRSAATSVANQTIEEIRALGWSTIEKGMTAADLAGDSNVVGALSLDQGCFEGNPLDIAGTIGVQSCAVGSWQDPSCLTSASLPSVPTASSIVSPAPVDPHQACYQVGSYKFGVDVYISGTSGTTYGLGTTTTPLTATVVVSWAKPARSGLSDHVVTTTELSDCLKGNAQCTSGS